MRYELRREPSETALMWQEHPDVIRRYYEDRLQYQQLCEEIKYTLQKNMNDANIGYSTITYRVKSVESFSKKFIHKTCKVPADKITDIAGVRLVYLYRNDSQKIEKVIQQKFNVLQKQDKSSEKAIDKFGYDAIHYSVTLKQEYSGARYDELKGLVCEIQVRTVMQDAWAIIEHHLAYKSESAIPKVLRRELHQLAAILENADGQFDRIRNEREKYIKYIEQKISNMNNFLAQEINFDTLIAFLMWYFPDINLKEKIVQDHLRWMIPFYIEQLNKSKFKKLADIKHLLLRTEKAREKLHQKEGLPVTPYEELMLALALIEKGVRKRLIPDADEFFGKYEHLVVRK